MSNYDNFGFDSDNENNGFEDYLNKLFPQQAQSRIDLPAFVQQIKIALTDVFTASASTEGEDTIRLNFASGDIFKLKILKYL